MDFSEKLSYYANLTEGCLCVQLDQADAPPSYMTACATASLRVENACVPR